MGSSYSKSQRSTFTVSDYPRTDPSLEGSDLRTRCGHAESPQICAARRRPARRLPTSAGGGGKKKVPPSHRGSERLAGVRHAACRRVLADAEKKLTSYAVCVASGRAVADMPYKRHVAGEMSAQRAFARSQKSGRTDFSLTFRIMYVTVCSS